MAAVDAVPLMSAVTGTATTSQMSELDVLIEGELIGRARVNKAGRLSFDYEPHWRDSPDGYSLSVSMPIASINYSHNLVSSYLWNLLPENPNILQRWGQQFNVSAASPFPAHRHHGCCRARRVLDRPTDEPIGA